MQCKLLYAFGFAFSMLCLPYAFSAYPYTYTTALYEIISPVPELLKSAMLPAHLGMSDYVTWRENTIKTFLKKLI